MQSFTKSQIKAMINVAKKSNRDVLEYIHISEHGGKAYITLTNGYIAALFNIDIELNEADKETGLYIHYSTLEAWVKTAKLNDILVDLNLFTMAEPRDKKPQYPSLYSILGKCTEARESTQISFNAQLAAQLQDISGEGGLHFTLYGEFAPMIANSSNGQFVLMPIRGN